MLLKKGIIRGLIVFLIMSGISLIMSVQGMDETQIRGTFIAGLIFTSVAIFSVIYDIKGWPFLKQSAVHFLLMAVTVFPCLLISGWFQLNKTTDYLKVFGVFLIVGFVSWALLYFIFGKLMSK